MEPFCCRLIHYTVNIFIWRSLMSDLTATNCGCSTDNGCGCNSIIWIILLLSCCGNGSFCGNNNGCGCSGGGNDCCWLILLCYSVADAMAAETDAAESSNICVRNVCSKVHNQKGMQYLHPFLHIKCYPSFVAFSFWI